MRKTRYPSDLTDEQWQILEPLLGKAPTRGRPRTVNLRDVIDAIFYITKTGCQWRYLPSDFPHKNTVWYYFSTWRDDGTLDRIHDALRTKVRTQEKPGQPRTTASIDSQSVDATSGGEQRGRDNHKNVNGRKRHIIVDSMGLLMAVLVTAANIDDAEAAKEAFERLEGQPMSQVKRVFADSKYHNHELYEYVVENQHWTLEIVTRPDGVKGWVLLPKRWVVERTFSWLLKARRLTVDREKTVKSSECFIKLAMIHLMLNRLEKFEQDPPFTYR
jgi:putative transposase